MLKLSQKSVRNRRRNVERAAFPCFINNGEKCDGSSLDVMPVSFTRWVPMFPMKAETGTTTNGNVENCHVSLWNMVEDKNRPNVCFSTIKRKQEFVPVRTMVAYDKNSGTADYEIKYRPVIQPTFVPVDFSERNVSLAWDGRKYEVKEQSRYYHDKVSAAKNKQTLLDMAEVYGMVINNGELMDVLNSLRSSIRQTERMNYRPVHNTLVDDISAFFNAPLAKREKTVNVEREKELAMIEAYMAKVAANEKATIAIEKKAKQSNKARKRTDQKSRTRTPRTKHAAMLRRYSLKYMK